jgi:hypothetical protein
MLEFMELTYTNAGPFVGAFFIAGVGIYLCIGVYRLVRHHFQEKKASTPAPLLGVVYPTNSTKDTDE